MKIAFMAGSVLMFLGGCDAQEHGANDWKEHGANSVTIHNQIGRFAFVQAQGSSPAMVLDSDTGCVDIIDKGSDGKFAISEVTNSCTASSQLPIVDTISRLSK